MSNEPTDKKKAWPLSLNSNEVGQIEAMMADNKTDDRTVFILGALRQLAALKPNHPDLLANLAALYHPTGKDELAAALAIYRQKNPRLNQARVLIHLFDALIKALADPSFKPSEPFELIDAAKMKEWETLSETRMRDFAQKVAEYQANYAASGSGNVSVKVKDGKGKVHTLTTRPAGKTLQSGKETGLPRLSDHPTDQPA